MQSLSLEHLVSHGLRARQESPVTARVDLRSAAAPLAGPSTFVSQFPVGTGKLSHPGDLVARRGGLRISGSPCPE
jgi:hypothetical protein